MRTDQGCGEVKKIREIWPRRSRTYVDHISMHESAMVQGGGRGVSCTIVPVETMATRCNGCSGLHGVFALAVGSTLFLGKEEGRERERERGPLQGSVLVLLGPHVVSLTHTCSTHNRVLQKSPNTRRDNSGLWWVGWQTIGTVSIVYGGEMMSRRKRISAVFRVECECACFALCDSAVFDCDWGSSPPTHTQAQPCPGLSFLALVLLSCPCIQLPVPAHLEQQPSHFFHTSLIAHHLPCPAECSCTHTLLSSPSLLLSFFLFFITPPRALVHHPRLILITHPATVFLSLPPSHSTLAW